VQVGPAIARYHAVSNNAIDLEAGFPVGAPIPPHGPVLASSLPGGKAATLLHWGPYATLPDSYDELEDWMIEQKTPPAGAPWDIYWVDPSQTDVEADLRTEIVWPILIDES
jgi:effector-binding domain-containing protein